MYEGLLNNDNARKYTEESVTELLMPVLERSKQPDCYFVLNALKDHITKSQYDYFTETFADNKTVLGILKTIQGNCEKNLVDAALEGKTKETMSIFLLKCKYGYVDKQVIETEHKGSINIDLQFPE